MCKMIWNSQIGEIPICQTEFSNLHEPYAVAIVMMDGTLALIQQHLVNMWS